MPDRLILRSLNSPYGDNTLGSVLSHADVDNNFIYLKGEIIYSAITGNGIVRLLKYNGNEVTFPLSGATIFYTNLTPTDVTIGGIEAGSTFSAMSMQEMWDWLLYPYQFPAFTSFLMTGHASLKEIGYDITPSQTFTWAISNPQNVQPNSVELSGYNLVTIPGLANDSSEPVTFTAPVTRSASDGVGIRTWNIQAQNTRLTVISTTMSIRWDWIMYAGTSLNTSLTESQIEALSNYNSVKTGFAGTYNMSAGGYKYFCFATTYGTPATWKDTLNGLNIAMYAGYPNTDVNGDSYDLVSVTNTHGETTDYRVYRSFNILNGAINIAIT